MPPEVTPQERYRLACFQDERSVLNQIDKAIKANVIPNNPTGLNNTKEVNPDQAVRRLRSLSAIGASLPNVLLSDSSTDSLHQLIQKWLDFSGPTIGDFWTTIPENDKAAHLDLVLRALTNNYSNLIDAIKAIPVNTVQDLIQRPDGNERTSEDWRKFFHDDQNRPKIELLPPFTAPGTAEERIEAFIRHLQKFFDVPSNTATPELQGVEALPLLGQLDSNPLKRFTESYNSRANATDFSFDSVWNESHFQAALNDVFPSDLSARDWLKQVLRTIGDLYKLTNIGLPEITADDIPKYRFSLMEALYARGFTGRQSIQGLLPEEFQAALTGTIAYKHAVSIYEKADTEPPLREGNGQRFQPINPDGSLTNCIPPLHLSPLGPVAYLYEMLRVSERSTYEALFFTDVAELKYILVERRGSLGDLLVTQANLETRIPLIDMVNECLEAIAATGSANGVVYNTASNEVAGHKLKQADSHAQANEEPFHHDPVALFAALPEHSSPATPVKQPSAYAELKQDFSSPVLPYSQPIDTSRSYLRQLRTSRYAVMRRFRKEITEFVLDPNNEPTEFQLHLWRYPVRINIAIEYLGITPEEYNLLFTHEIAVKTATEDRLLLRELYGFAEDTVARQPWTQIVIKVSEFLQRTGLTYCEFLDLWQSKFVEFRRVGEHPEFPTCAPCYLDKLVIQFEKSRDASKALKRLIVFIRLWHKLQQVEGAKYSFWQLRDICEVLQLFRENGSINPDFIRQLAAFQILRDRLSLWLTDGTITSGTGADRTHLLSLWVGVSHSKWDWAVDHLLDQMQRYALARHHCGCRPPEFIKLLSENLDPLSRLAGFDPGSSGNTWHAHPTHTLRFVEILAKIYASDFSVGDIIFLFTVDDHLEGDDPFPLQPKNEAICSPLGLPDDEYEYSLWDLRCKLLAVEVCDEEAEAWTWTRIEAILREEFGFILSSSSPDPLLSFGEHFFPTILEDCGCPVDLQKRQYRVDLASSVTSVSMWNTPLDGPFHYDSANQKLWTQLPLTDEAVLAKISRVRPLKPEEQQAVQDLYFLPRVTLAQFAFIFPNFAEADERLIQEVNEAKRWAYFQRAFAICYARCRVIAEHLAEHVVKVTGKSTAQGIGLAWQLLKHLFADENQAKTPWEDDTGVPPEVTWSQPNGGAFAALLGLTGTGLLGEFTSRSGLVWRELRGPMDAFSPTRNAWNAPVPTVLPSMNLTLTSQQEKFVGIRNGFALANGDGKRLGGAQAFAVRWRGVLLVETEGPHGFWAGAPTPDGEEPDFHTAKECQWRVMLRRGQKTWVLLSHQWPHEEAPATCSSPLCLKRGAYDLIVEFVQPAPTFKDLDELCPQTTGFQVKYAGPDTCDRLIAIPFNRLFQDWSDRTFDEQVNENQVISEHQPVPIDGEAKRFLNSLCRSSLRNMRRTYQRTFKALLFAHQFELSAKPISDSEQSEISYMLAHADDFTGMAYYRSDEAYAAHRAYFNFNFLPLNDNYYPPQPTDDQRVQPSIKRQQALFDWWERIFDYTTLRREAQLSPERPVWFLFHEAAENHPDEPAHLLRHMGVDLSHAAIALHYYLDHQVSSADLEDERWAIRVWMTERWLRNLYDRFFWQDIREARPDLWAANDPEANQGNENLTQFVRDGLIENGEPRRYEEIKRLNDGLRLRARQALLAYLCAMNRVSLPWGGHAHEPKDLSDLLLLDVETGLCETASRIEEAIGAIHLFVQRSRLGLEPGWSPSPEFILLWERRFATFYVWEACKHRELYRENWIDWEELEKARHTEAFQFLEAELRRTTLTVPIPGGLEHWPNQRLPIHPGIMLMQVREPDRLKQLSPSPEGFDLLGSLDRHACPSWLAPLRPHTGSVDSPISNPISFRDNSFDNPELLVINGDTSDGNSTLSRDAAYPLPLWIQAAIRLGVRFVRVAAASEPPASTRFEPHSTEQNAECCMDCDRPHPALIDEYYFWLLDSRYYKTRKQEADWRTPPVNLTGDDVGTNPGATDDMIGSDWHQPEMLPKLLNWESEQMVHLAWCRIHNGVQQIRRSDEGVRVSKGSTAQLELVGREGDSLKFKVLGGQTPIGYPESPQPGFRYDLATDTAVVLPLVDSPPPTAIAFPGGLTAYPYFAYFTPGDRLFPASLFSPVVSVAGNLRAHCRFEAALKWYEQVYNPLQEDSTWAKCAQISQDNSEENPVVRALVVNGQAPCCESGLVSYEVVKDRSITLHYLETLVQWGDALMRRRSPEALQQAKLIFETAMRILGDHPHKVVALDLMDEPRKIAEFVPFVAPLNPRLLNLYETVGDRLLLSHTCLNDRRLRNGHLHKDMPYWGNTPMRNGWQTTAQTCPDETDWCYPHSPYRFFFLVQKAQEIANEVRSLGAALLSAFEKGDAEYLASLRATHERQLLNLALEIRQNQWREADWQVQALYKTKEIAQTRKRYYDTLMRNGLNSAEQQYAVWIGISLASRYAANISETAAQSIGSTPDFWYGGAGFAGSPLAFKQLPVGTKMAGVSSTVARISNIAAEVANTSASLSLTEAGWDRREEEWRHQVEVLTIEIEQIERQILAAERRRDIALRELNNYQRQMEHAAEVHDFLRDKFTNHALYLWLQRETAALHNQMYVLALHTARQAQRAFNYERGYTARSFVPTEVWDTLRDGLLAGERLHLSLRQMEKAYLDENLREYELMKHFSLRLHFPLEFLQLKVTGYCEIDIPEWMFDLDYPGHYMRRLKNVTMTLPCVVGPYTGVHCRLTLLSSMTRVDPRLSDSLAVCCGDGKPGNGYVALPDDSRIVKQYGATEAIATSTGQNDSGLFELSFRDERYLPFEFAGAVSRWRIELPQENNQFDIDTLSDVVLHLNYTAREGGEALRWAANEVAQQNLPGAGLRFFDINHEFPDVWHRFQSCSGDRKLLRQLVLRLDRNMFAFLPGRRDLWINRLDLFFEAPGAEPSAHQVVEFLVGYNRGGHISEDRCECEVQNIHCIASAEWPGLYHGVLDVRLGPLSQSREPDLGTFRFPPDIGVVSRAFLFCSYDVK